MSKLIFEASTRTKMSRRVTVCVGRFVVMQKYGAYEGKITLVEKESKYL